LPRVPSSDTVEHARRRADDALVAATERLPIIGTVIEAGHRERSRGGGLLAGGLAYRLFFWLVPVGLVAAAAGKLLGTTRETDLSAAANHRGIAGLVAAAERQAMETSTANTWILLGTGIVFSVWFGIGVVRALMIVHALAWELPQRKVGRPILSGAIFTVVAAVLSLMASGISRLIGWIGFGALALIVALVVTYAMVGFGVTAIFPHPITTPRMLLPGAILIGVGGFGLHVFVNYYLAPKITRSVNTYGILGAATVILLWLYIVARLITVSAFLNAEVHEKRSAHLERFSDSPDTNVTDSSESVQP
jgi:uncharacterized BrkB/YihY/UPF0761 family membrane protein